MTIPCPHCGESLAGPRLRRLGREARVDLALCGKCEKNWRIHLDSQGETLLMEEMTSDYVPPPNAISIGKGSGWGEGRTVMTHFDIKND